jgi:DNA (cytosine-5)-methyltransferase 1
VVGSRDLSCDFPASTHSGPHETRTAYDETLKPHVTTAAAIGDLADRDDLAEEQEPVNGKYGHLLPDIPPGDNYLFFTAKRGHPKPLFEWRKRYWSFLLKLDPEQPSPTIQAQPGPYVGPFHWRNRRLRLPEILRLQSFPDGYEIVGSRRSAQVQVGNAVPPVLAEKVAERLAA